MELLIQQSVTGQGAHYMLRRCLPVWKPAETIAETLAFCEEVGIGEIIWKVDVEEFNHGFTSHEIIRRCLPWLKKARDMQTKKGVLFSINPWLTFGHADRGHYSGGPPPGFRWRVSSSGREITGITCPLSEGWPGWFLEAYRLYATTKPDKLWVEDDFRTFVWSVGPTEIGCFCPEHLRTFSERLGESLARKSLVHRLIKPGAPDPVRSAWLDFNGEIMVNLCRELEKVVHKECPSTRLGLMNSSPIDGRWWEEAMRALAGPLRPLARPSMGPYSEPRAIEYLPGKTSLHIAMACLPDDTEVCPELENYPYTSYSKSASMTRLELGLSQVLGNHAITLNLVDFIGSPMSSETRIGKMLKEAKPLLDSIAQVAGPGGRPRGVSIPFQKRYGDSFHVAPGEGFPALGFNGDGWALPLQGSGIPIVINGDTRVSAVTGQSARAMSAEQIDILLRGGLILDGSAAAVLHEMGYGHLIGVEVGSKLETDSFICGAERDDWAEGRTEDDPAYMSLRQISCSDKYVLHPLSLIEGAIATSVLVDPDRKSVMPGMVVFQNQLCGRVAVYPFDLSAGINVGFMNWNRRSQLQRIVRWLGRDAIDLFVDGGAWMMPVRRDYPGYTFVAVINMETDPWEDIVLTFECASGAANLKVEHLDAIGIFRGIKPAQVETDGPNIMMRMESPLPPLDFAVFRLVRLQSD